MTLPLGYRYAALYAGIRKTKKNDLALIISDEPAQAAAVFTRNIVVAAPVVLARKHLDQTNGVVRAVLVNAGNANCATRTGADVARESVDAVAKALHAPVEQVIPSSTGVIGVEMDSRKITRNAGALVKQASADAFDQVADAILTTDLVAKKAGAAMSVKGGGEVRIAGFTKGSGMIHPDMATTLGYVMTDAAIPAATLRGILRRAIAVSYNALSVDGDTSTNDMVILLANGASGVKLSKQDLAFFEQALTLVLCDLARQIARDGEGAKKLITIDVEGAKSGPEAMRIARAIGNSPLVKTAIAGSDPNWGRILAAAGYSGATFDPAKTDIDLQGVAVCRGGLAADFSEAKLKKLLDRDECAIQLKIRGNRSGRARFFTCDLTEGYIRINGSYRT